MTARPAQPRARAPARGKGAWPGPECARGGGALLPPGSGAPSVTGGRSGGRGGRGGGPQVRARGRAGSGAGALGSAGPGRARFRSVWRDRPRPSPSRRPLPAAPVPRAPSFPPRPRSAPRRAARAAAAPPAAPGCPAERLAALRRGVGPSRRSLSSPFGADRFVSRCSLCQPGGAGSGALRGRVSVGPCGPAASRSGLGATRSVRAPLAAGAFRGGAASETYRDRELAWITGEIGVRLLARCVKLNAAPRGFCGARARLQLQLPPALSPGSTAERRDGFPLSNLPGYPSRAAICLPVFSLPCRHRSGCRRLSGRSGRTCRENGGGAQRRAPLGFVSAVLAGNTSVSAHTVSANGVCVCVCVFLQGKPGSEQRLFLPLASCCHCLTSVLC